MTITATTSCAIENNDASPFVIGMKLLEAE